MPSGQDRPRTIRRRLALTASCATLTLIIAPLVFSNAYGDTSPSQQKAIEAADAAMGGKSLASGQSLQRVNVVAGDRDQKLNYINYDLKSDGRRVVGAESVVVADDHGKVRDISRPTLSDVPTKVSAAIKPEAATAIATKDIAVTSVSTPELVVLATQVPKPISAYEIVVEGTLSKAGAKVPTYQHVFVDANQGTVAARAELSSAFMEDQGFYNGKVKLEKTSASYESTLVKGWNCTDPQGKVFSGPGNGQAMDYASACVDVQYAVETQNRLLKDWFNRDGLDGHGGTAGAEVGLQDANAYWTGKKAVFGHNKNKNKQITGLDAVGHEYGHGLLIASGRGIFFDVGIQEAAADIAGTSLEFYANNPLDKPDYTMGENLDFWGDGKPNRYLYQPSLDKRSPDCYGEKMINEHAAGGPIRHWFYLMAEGTDPTNGNPKSPTCNNTKLEGVGIQLANKVWYNGTMRRNGGTTTWAMMRSYTLAAAKDLGQGCTLFNKTKAAWDAVSVNASASDPSCDGSNTPTTTSKPTTSAPKPSTTAPKPSTTAPKPSTSKPQPTKPTKKPFWWPFGD